MILCKCSDVLLRREEIAFGLVLWGYAREAYFALRRVEQDVAVSQPTEHLDSSVRKDDAGGVGRGVKWKNEFRRVGRVRK